MRVGSRACFEGRLPDFSWGPIGEKSCSVEIQDLVQAFASSIEGFSAVVNERFIGGYITRRYGQKETSTRSRWEMVQENYMNENDLTWDTESASRVRPVLQSLVRRLLKWIQWGGRVEDG